MDSSDTTPEDLGQIPHTGITASVEAAESQYGTFPTLSRVSPWNSPLQPPVIIMKKGNPSAIKESSSGCCLPDRELVRSRDADCLMSKDEVGNMCDGVRTDTVATTEFAHWQSIVLVTCFCCPICGLVAGLLSCRAYLFQRSHEEDGARRMLGHSKFCMRLAVIFGIIVWFIILMIFVLYRPMM